MIEAYAIGVNLSLQGNIGAQIAAVAQQFENLNRIIAGSQAAVNGLASGIQGLSGLGRSAADAWKDAAAAMERAARATRRAQDAAQNYARTPPTPAAAAFAALAAPEQAAIAAPGQAAPAPPSMMRLPRPAGPSMPLPGTDFLMWNDPPLPTGGGSVPRLGPPAPPAGNSGGPGAGALATIPTPGTFPGGPGAPYTPGLPALVPPSGAVANQNGGIPLNLGGGIPLNYTAPMQRPAMPGTHDVALAAAGFGALGAALTDFVGNAVRARSELEHQENLLHRAEVPTEVITEATRRAWETFNTVRGSRVADNLRMFGELRSQVSSDHQAIELMPDMARIGLLLQNETHQAPDKLAQTMMRLIEMRGQAFGADGHTLDLDRVRHELALAYQAMSVSHGLVTPQTFLGFQQQAGPAGMAMTPEAFYQIMPTAMQTMGGHRSGTALASLFSQFVGGVMTQRTATELVRLELLDPNKVHVRRGGQVTVDPGAISGFDMHNPFSFFAGENSPFQSAVRSHGGGNAAEALEGVLDPKVTQELYRALGRETTRRLVAEFIALAPTFERDQRLRTQSMDPAAAEQEAQRDPNMRATQFGAAMNGLMVALGGPILDSAMSALQTITNVVLKLGEFSKEHPDLTKNLMLATAGVAGFSLAMAALSGVFLVAGPMFRVATWLGLTVGMGTFSVALRGLGAALGLLGVGTAAGGALASLPVALGALGAALLRLLGPIGIVVGAATLAGGAITAISRFFGGKPPEPGQENHPNGIAPTAPTFGPQHRGDPSQAPGLLQRQSYRPPPVNVQAPVTQVSVTLDGRAIAANVETRIVRSGSGPSGGSTGFDGRTVYSGGMAMA